MSKIIVVSGYTKDDYYAPHAVRLKQECDKLGQSCLIYSDESRGDYIANTRLKPMWVDRAYWHLSQMSWDGGFLWVDVDASILKPLEWAEQNLPGYDFAGARMPASRNRTWHVGTLYFGMGRASLDLISRWMVMAHDGRGTDEGLFDEAVRKLPRLRFNELPKSYFRVERINQKVPADTVILHRLSTVSSKMERKRNARA